MRSVFILALAIAATAAINSPYGSSDENNDEDELIQDTSAELVTDVKWPARSVTRSLGQVSGVDFDPLGVPHILHRADRDWDENTFDEQGNFKLASSGKIKSNTIMKVDRKTGKQLEAWGANLFYLPHGLTIDQQGNVWVTDVAAHQVFKFTAQKGNGPRTPALVLGEALKSGSDAQHFCQPTDVAVASSGVFFVADGYCNSRIMKFDATGRLLKTWGQPTRDPQNPQPDELSVPHSLALMESEDVLCVADRENWRIVCYNAGLNNATRTGEFAFELTHEAIGPVYGIAFDTQTGELHGVGLRSHDGVITGLGFTFERNGDLDTWAPTPQGFGMPHDIAVSRDGRALLVATLKPKRVWKLERQAGWADEARRYFDSSAEN